MKVEYYRNNRNRNKHLEVHRYTDSHIVVDQCMVYPLEGVINWVGGRMGHRRMRRWRKGNLSELLEDYTKIYEEVRA